MFKNYLKSTIRSLFKNKTFSFLNVFGLAVGITCASLIFLWVEDEMHFDHNHIKRDRLSIIKVNDDIDNGVFTHSSTPGLMGPSIQTELPGVANTCRMSEGGTPLFAIGNRALYAQGNYTDPSVFAMFTLPFAQGNAQTAFAQLYSIVLTEKSAKKFFGDDQNILGRSLRIDNQQDYVVTGVLKDLPENSSIQFEWLAPFQVYWNKHADRLSSWGYFGLSTYVELTPGTNAESINQKLKDYIQMKKGTATSTVHAFLFSMNDWRLRDDFANGKMTGGGRIQYVRLFSAIAWIILLLGCINFMNLATARSDKRAREVGVRKVLGASRNSLVWHFLADTIFMALLAAVSAIVMLAVTLPLFNALVEKNLALDLSSPAHAGALLLLTIICGLIAGIYPSLYLSAFSPVRVLKGLKTKNGSAALTRKGLVVLQFAVSIILIIGTIVIYQQIRHIKNRNLGYNRANLIQMPAQQEVVKNFAVIKQDLLNTHVVAYAALADHETISGGNNTTGIDWEGKPANSIIIISQRSVSPDFIQTAGMHIREGRDFTTSDVVAFGDDNRPVDSTQVFNVLITESMAELMGKGSAIGKTLSMGTDKGNFRLHVAGVIDNYVYGDMYGTSSPVIFYCVPQIANLLYVRSAAQSDPQDVLSKLEAVMKKDNPSYPFDYTFVDDQFNKRFTSESLVSKLSQVFASLAILISCLGLFGLAAYTAERRKKEVGIRKVLGASVAGISALLSINFLQLVALSCLIAFPVAWWVMHQWLRSYQYRIEINLWIFPLAGVLAMVIAICTISFQSVRAAVMNPVKTLRTE